MGEIMEPLISEISHTLNKTLSSDKALVSAAADRLNGLSSLPGFLICLMTISKDGDAQGLKMAAAIYLKNFVRCHEVEIRASSGQYIDFRNQLAHILLQVDHSILKVLAEAFNMIIASDFVKENCWPGLIPELRSVIQNSKLISQSPSANWNTINALIVLQTTIKPFQYFLNPTISKEPVPSQLELIAETILTPLQGTFHLFVEKALSNPHSFEKENEEFLLVLCKCIYFSVRSYIPSALKLALPSFCNDWFRILDSLRLFGDFYGVGHLLRLKTVKRIIIIFCALVTRHRKHFDKLMPNIIKCSVRIVKQNADISMLDTLPERIVSLAFDLISHVLETGPGWRLVSPQFSSLLESAIFPAIVLNHKDTAQWEEDTDEYIRKNLPSELDSISGWTEGLFTARKSAINLLGVIAMSKGPPLVSGSSKHNKRCRNKKKEPHNSVGDLLVVPFLSKFPLPCGAVDASSKVLRDYYGVLMAYGGLQDFFKGKSSEYMHALLQHRLLPVFSLCHCSPYLLSTANWILGELACCLPQVMRADIYNSLTMAMALPNRGDFSCYPVRASAVGAISELVNHEYFPPEWLPLLQVLVGRMDIGDENESCLLFDLLSTVVEAGPEKIAVHIPVVVSNIGSIILREMPPIPEHWPQVVERGFTALAKVAQIWESYLPEDIEHPENREWRSSWASIANLFSNLLQKAWLMPAIQNEKVAANDASLPSICIDDASTLLGFIMRFITESDEVSSLKIADLLSMWSSLIADWDSCEEIEDQSVFNSIREAVNLQRKFDQLQILFARRAYSSFSLFENFCTFVCEAIISYASATWRACSCMHTLLHVPGISSDTVDIKLAMGIKFARAAFSRFMAIHEKPSQLWKPLLLAISACYVLYPEEIEQVLDKEEDKGFIVWASALAHISTGSFAPGLSTKSEIILSVVTLTKVIERLLTLVLDSDEALKVCSMALLDAFSHMKEVREGNAESEVYDEEASDDSVEDDEDEESEDEQREETEEEFLERYAKAAADLEEEMVEEGDVEDEGQELELGMLDEVDIEGYVVGLLERCGGELPETLTRGLMDSFPEHKYLFHFH